MRRGRYAHECGYRHRPELLDLLGIEATDSCEQSDWVLATELESSAKWTCELPQVLLFASGILPTKPFPDSS